MPVVKTFSGPEADLLVLEDIAHVDIGLTDSKLRIRAITGTDRKVVELLVIEFEGRAYVNRITSYNVCYTKLLRSKSQRSGNGLLFMGDS